MPAVIEFFPKVSDLQASTGRRNGDVSYVEETDAHYKLERAAQILVVNDDTSVAAEGGGHHLRTAPPLDFFGSTTGLAQDQSVELVCPYTASGYLDADALADADNIVVHVEVDAPASGIDIGNANAKIARTMIINKATAYKVGTAVTLDSAGATSGSGDAATANWTLVAAHAAAGGGKPERIALTFETGANNAHKVNVRATVSLQAGRAFPA